MNAQKTEQAEVVLIKPTLYDDDGFVQRFWLGVLPSNSLAQLNSITSKALRSIITPDTNILIHVLEDGLLKHARELRKLARSFPKPETKLIVGLVAVQSAQFPRALDIMTSWQQKGAVCVIGGFHVSGIITTMLDGVNDPKRPNIPCPKKMPEEIQSLMERGIIVFHGEAEIVWKEALQDILNGSPKKLYRGGRPNLTTAPLPLYPDGYFEGNFATRIGTFDTGRGCPLSCNFCTIINVQGRESRYRTPADVIQAIKELCISFGKASFFFTDDNFGRNPLWEDILDGIIALRKEGRAISFMIEADLVCGKIPDFLAKLAEAGCRQIFMGVESMNPANLKDAHKFQNQVGLYQTLWNRCHELGILVHAGYIIGFPKDTPESVKADIEKLAEFGADQASFFMLTPLPGSENHAWAVANGDTLHPDLSRYDSFHVTTPHPIMSDDEWMNAYRSAWHQFYSVPNMVRALKRCASREARMDLLRNYVWYRWSFATENAHPMVAGFYRLRPYSERRPGSAPLSYGRYLAQEVWRHIRYIGRFASEFYRFQHVMWEVEGVPAVTETCERWTEHLRGVGDWFRLTFGKKPHRRWLNSFWVEYTKERWELVFNPLKYGWHLLMVPCVISEIVYTARFIAQVLKVTKEVT